MVFIDITIDDLNNRISSALTSDMSFTQVYEELDRVEQSYFYISCFPEDVLEAISDEKEIADQLNLELICIVPQGVYVALYN